VRDAEAEREERGVFEGAEAAGREAGSGEGGPEQVAGTGEVMADGGAVATGVDAAEEDVEVGTDHVRHTLSGGGFELRLRRAPGGLGRLGHGRRWMTIERCLP